MLKKIIYSVVSLLHLLILIGLLMGSLSFGFGLGDILYSCEVLILVIIDIFILIKVLIKRNHKNQIVGLVIYLLVTIYILMQITILRGIENPWKGNVFI